MAEGKGGARTKRKWKEPVQEIEAAMDGAKEREEEKRKEALKGKTLLNAAMEESRKAEAKLRAEKLRSKELKEELHKMQTEIIHLRQAMVEATGGIEFTTFLDGEMKKTEIKEHIGGKKREISVELLTATLVDAGVLETVVRKLRELEEVPADTFLTPGFNKNGNDSNHDKNGSLVRQLREVVDEGEFQRREDDLKEREHEMRIREEVVEKREQLVEEKLRRLIKATEDPLMKILEEQKQRIKEMQEQAWMAVVEKELNVTRGDGNEGAEEESGSFAGVELRADEQEVKDFEGATEGQTATNHQTEKPKPTVSELLGELETCRAKFKCNTKVDKYVQPYIADCVARASEGKPYLNFEQYCDLRMVCTICYCQGEEIKKHLAPMCRLKCCGNKRCERCLHVHLGPRCVCDHAVTFLAAMEKAMKAE